MDNIKDNIRERMTQFLRITPATPSQINILETLTFEGNALKDRIWYRGDSSEIEQLYSQMTIGPADKYKFWACRCTPGQEIRKLHTGLPAIIVDTLATATLTDFNGIQIDDAAQQDKWDEISEENHFDDLLESAVKEALVVGDGAFKISFDPDISKFPILEFYPADNVDFKYNRGRITEIIFRTAYKHKTTEFILLEKYGKGYINYSLTKDGKEVPIDSIPETAVLQPLSFSDTFMAATPFKIFDSSKYKGRGQSILDRKIDSFDGLDEIWSQWLDALRSGRSKQYIPECFIPKNPETGEIMKPNPFDNRYIACGDDMHEGGVNKVDTEQPEIRSNDYLQTYITALDLCLQGLISPSTLGIDVKKLDNAEAQREKEKATLYTRNKIVNALQKILPAFVEAVLNAYQTYIEQPLLNVKCSVEFGEYANPSFESQVETVGKAKAQGIMSIERCVEELYGDTLTDAEKGEEIARLKNEQGIIDMDEPSLSG